jgi:uncharacterized protein
MYKKSAYVTVINDFPSPSRHLVHNTLTKATVVLDPPLLEALVEGIPESHVNAVSDYQQLAQMGIAVKDNLDEKRLFQYWINTQRYEKDCMDHVIFVSNACNLDCQYCTGRRLKLAKANDYMSKEVADKYLRFLDAEIRSGRTKFSVEFFGGEPLLNLEIVEHIAGGVRRIEELYGVKARKTSLITNGTLLTKSVMDRLCACGIDSVQLTLDGPKKINDERKVSGNGKAS